MSGNEKTPICLICKKPNRVSFNWYSMHENICVDCAGSQEQDSPAAIRIRELEAQIDRMKCCMNCEHSNGRGTCVGITMEEWRECFNGNYAKWRLRE